MKNVIMSEQHSHAIEKEQSKCSVPDSDYFERIMGLQNMDPVVSRHTSQNTETPPLEYFQKIMGPDVS